MIKQVVFRALRRKEMPDAFQRSDKKPHCDVSQMAFSEEISHSALPVDQSCVLGSESDFHFPSLCDRITWGSWYAKTTCMVSVNVPGSPPFPERLISMDASL